MICSFYNFEHNLKKNIKVLTYFPWFALKKISKWVINDQLYDKIDFITNFDRTWCSALNSNINRFYIKKRGIMTNILAELMSSLERGAVRETLYQFLWNSLSPALASVDGFGIYNVFWATSNCTYSFNSKTKKQKIDKIIREKTRILRKRIEKVNKRQI